MRKHAYQLTALAAAVGLALAACGGGSGTSNTPTGTVNVQVTDGPSDEFQNVWVTFTAIAFHTDPSAQWNPADATWQVIKLSSPQTINLATLNNGSLNNLFMGLNLASGTYRQVRFLLDGPDAPLDASALATDDSNGTPLQWNDQVEYLANGSTTLLEAPLEIAYPTQGIQLVGTFVVPQNGTISVAVDFDLEHDIVPFNHDGMTYFTMRPNLQYYDMTQVGAITGTISTAELCQSVTAAVSQATACAYNLIVKAELLAPDGQRHFVARQTTVDPATGAFTLYPLATKDANGNTISSYDVLIRGREMETMLVTGVPVKAGTNPTGTDATAPTPLPATVTPVLNSDEYFGQFASALSPLSGGYAIFQQTLSGGVPYEVRWRNTDPFTGEFRNPIALQGASSQLQVASYTNFTFSPQSPVEGNGGFSVADNEVAYYTLASAGVMLPAATGATKYFSPAAPALDNGVQSGTINVTLDFSNISIENNCELVLARFASIIDTYNCSSFLSTNGGSNSGNFTLTGVPAGDSTTPVPGAFYYAYVRLWETGHGKATRLIVPLDGFIDLRSTTSATLNGSIVGE